MMSTAPPIILAEQLAQLVRTVYQHDSGEQTLSPKDAYDKRNHIVTFCDELKRIVMGPLEYTVTLAESCHESSALRLITELGVADIIGDDTRSLSEISKEAGVDVHYLKIAMACINAHGYFDEVKTTEDSDVYRNNAMSEVLRSGGKDTIKEALGFICDEGLKSTSYLLEAATARIHEGASSLKENPSPASLAFGFESSFFEWATSPDQVWRSKRLGKAMQQLHRVVNTNVITDFEWNELDSPVVDIGGGIGSLEMGILNFYPQSALNFIIFDIPETVQNARKIWSSQASCDQTQVSFAAGDFLASTAEGTGIPKSQPTYVIRHVLHDWTDEQVVSILRNVHEAMLSVPSAGKPPKLLLCEMLLQRTSSRFVRTTSIQLLALNNGRTRTETEMIKLLEEAGFSVIKVHSMRSVDTIIAAIPSA